MDKCIHGKFIEYESCNQCDSIKASIKNRQDISISIMRELREIKVLLKALLEEVKP